MARAQARIFRINNPAGWAWSFDRLDTPDAGIDNFATAVSPNAALDAIKPLIQVMPGTLSKIDFVADTFEP